MYILSTINHTCSYALSSLKSSTISHSKDGYVRKPLIAGNWKMHGSRSQAAALIQQIQKESPTYPDVDILICPPFVYMQQAHELLVHSAVKLGAQNLYPGTQGAFTGEVSASMLADVGCCYVIIGHSERRTLFHEDAALIAAKFKAATEAKL